MKKAAFMAGWEPSPFKPARTGKRPPLTAPKNVHRGGWGNGTCPLPGTPKHAAPEWLERRK
jgi:hypothetical protein